MEGLRFEIIVTFVFNPKYDFLNQNYSSVNSETKITTMINFSEGTNTVTPLPKRSYVVYAGLPNSPNMLCSE